MIKKALFSLAIAGVLIGSCLFALGQLSDGTSTFLTAGDHNSIGD
ncbi:MAG TPA: hypothetical protein VF199_00695 [Bacillales bacterium]